jgi:Zn-dependent metalloprotease
MNPLPRCCVLPDFILNNIAVNSPDPSQRRLVLRSQSITNSLSQARVGFSESNRAAFSAQRSASRQFSSLLQQPEKNRTIYTAGDTERTPGTPVRKEGQPAIGDPAVDEAYQYMGATFDFYWNVFQRNSIDNKGMDLIGSVHYSTNYDNAFWDGKQMDYGDGDDKQFIRFTVASDVIGHEMTHGVTQYESGLIYFGETGALNESISDVFGSMVKQYYYNQTVPQADWLIGQGLFTPSVHGVAIRSLKAPGTAYNDPVLGKDPQPATMSGYVHTMQDNGGVHINSGIPNHAFYLAATQLGGHSWETIGPIWYAACTSNALHKTANFQAFATLTVQVAQQAYPGFNSPQVQAIKGAWAQVGIVV